MRYNNILLIIIFIQLSCFKKQSEKDLLNKVDSIGYYGSHPVKGLSMMSMNYYYQLVKV